MDRSVKRARVVWTLTACTSLSLLGDATMYAVLPSQYAVVGLATLHVGWLLSVNRLVRLPLNTASGWLSDRFDARVPYAAGLMLGAVSTIGYGLWKGFWPLLVFRALWGVAWALLAVAVVAGAMNLANLDAPWGVLHHLLGGALLFGAFFIATDPVTSPLTPLGKFLFGIGIGLAVVVIRLFSGYPEGVMFAVLLMNAAVPLINRWTIPRPVGGPVPQRA